MGAPPCWVDRPRKARPWATDTASWATDFRIGGQEGDDASGHQPVDQLVGRLRDLPGDILDEARQEGGHSFPLSHMGWGLERIESEGWIRFFLSSPPERERNESVSPRSRSPLSPPSSFLTITRPGSPEIARAANPRKRVGYF